MNKQDFFLNVIEHSQAEGFYFLEPKDVDAQPRQMSEGRQNVYRIISGAAFGLVGALSTGYFNVPSRQQLAADLRRMNEHCDVVGINLSNGPVILRLAWDADALDDYSIIGRFPKIHQLTHDFQQYGASLAMSGKMGARSQVLITFSSHARASEFNETSAATCKQSSFWKKIYTEAWVVDLETNDIKRFRHGGEFLARDMEGRKAGFFRARS